MPARKKLTTKKILNYTAVFEPSSDGGFVVHVPALPGCHTQGKDLNEAYKMAQDAIYGYIMVLRDLRAEIPTESDNSFAAKIAVRV